MPPNFIFVLKELYPVRRKSVKDTIFRKRQNSFAIMDIGLELGRSLKIKYENMQTMWSGD